MSITGTRTIASIVTAKSRQDDRLLEWRRPPSLEEVAREARLGVAAQ
jgi:hypothetical protein